MPVNAVTQINEMIEENEEDTKKKNCGAFLIMYENLWNDLLFLFVAFGDVFFF